MTKPSWSEIFLNFFLLENVNKECSLNITLSHFIGSEQIFQHLVSSVVAISSNSSLVPRCNTVTQKRDKCLCHYEFCLSWYPCALKYCDDTNQAGVSYRCGIKTCGKCRQFQYHVNERNDCFWDTPFNNSGI